MDRFLRPSMTVLPESAMAPEDFTHAVLMESPCFEKQPDRRRRQPSGSLPAGTKVRLLRRGRGKTCLVADSAGRKLYIASTVLEPLSDTAI